MHECGVDIIAERDDTFTLDIHEPGSSGTSRTIQFLSWNKLEGFFRSLGVGEEKLAELHETGTRLEKGNAYHQTMFLPISAAGETER